MSRLQSHRSKQNARRLLFLAVLTVGLFVFLSVVGLRSIINATIFVNTVITGNSPEKKVTSDDSEFFGTLSFDEPQSATNSAEIMVTGSVTEFDQVEYFINNVSVEKEAIPSTDQFEHAIGKLKVGENKIYVVVSDTKTKKKKHSDTYNVLYKNEKPKLEIESPKDGDKTNNNEITIKGKTDKGTEVTVNNSHVVLGITGDFSKTVRLQDGDNKLTIIATDIAGNEEKKEMTVRYEKDN